MPFWIVCSDQIGSKLQSESARELSMLSFRRNWQHLLKWCTRKIHPQRYSKKKKICPCPECIWPQSRWGRDVAISAPTGRYLPTTLIIQSLVKLSLLSWTCMTLYKLVMRWKDSLFNRITGFYDPICTPIKTVIKRYSKTLRQGKLLSLIIFFSCSWRWISNDSWA